MFISQPVAMSKLYSGDIYIFGGANALPSNYMNSSTTIQRFTGSARSTMGQVLPLKTRSASATGGVAAAFIFGGLVNEDGTETAMSYYTTSIQKYTGTALTTEASVLPTSTSIACAAKIGNDSLIYSYQGIFRHNGVVVSSESALQFPVAGASAAAIGNLNFIYGGTSPSADSGVFNIQDVRLIQRYNGTTASIDSATLDPTSPVGPGANYDEFAQYVYTAACAFNGYNYIFGGRIPLGNGSHNKIQRYDGLTRITHATSLSTAVEGASSAAIERQTSNACYIFGGVDSSGTGSFKNIIQKFDGNTCVADSAVLAATNAFSAAATIGQSQGFK